MIRPLSLVCFAAALALLLAAPRSAAAHARYESSFPAKGEVLATSPDRVEITFSQEIQRISGTYDIMVNKDRGLSVTAGPAVVRDDDRRIMSVPLQPGLAPGRYVVHWRNVSDEDGDPAEGAFSFYVQTPPNEIDLRNDEALALIGEEDAGTPTPTADGSPSPAETGTAAATTPEASPRATAVTDADSDDGGGDDGGLVIVIVTVIVVGVVAAAAAFYVVQRRGQ